MNATGTRPRQGEELELEIDSLAQGGRGVARADGYVVFVSGALPGDRVRARLTKREAATTPRAPRSSSCGPSSERIAERCVHEGEPVPRRPVAGDGLRAPARREARARSTRPCGASGRLDGFELEPIEPAVAEWRYRNKLEYCFGERPGELVLGFHERGSWAEIVDVDDCLLASEANNAARNAVRDWGHRQGLDAYDSRARGRRAAQPRRPRGPAHRPDPDPPGHLARPRSRARRSTCTP